VEGPQGPHILIVEDEPAVGRALARALTRDGYRVDVARTHADSLTFSANYACGIFDIELPDSDGVELARRLKARGVVREVVFFSGLSDGKTEMRAREQGAYVHKSEGLVRLRSVIAGAISTP
jgi:DNA-binding response OmpR family regulator